MKQLHAEICLGADNAPPGEIMLLPAGPEIAAREHDGRHWELPDPEEVARVSNASTPIAIDYDHQQQRARVNGQPAPAAGWINKIFVKGGAILASVQWTDRAAAMVKAREYRFVSPVLLHNKANRVKRIIGAALVNNPALEMPALAAAQIGETMDKKNDKKEDQKGTPQEADSNPLREQLIGLLKLTADVDDAAIAAAVKALLGEGDAMLAAADKNGATSTASGDANLTKDVRDLQAQVAQLGAGSIQQEVDEAIRSGRLPPAQRGWALGYATAQPQGFRDFLAAQPQILVEGSAAQEQLAVPATLSEDELAVCTAMGIAPEQYRKHNPQTEVLK